MLTSIGANVGSFQTGGKKLELTLNNVDGRKTTQYIEINASYLIKVLSRYIKKLKHNKESALKYSAI